MADFQHLVDPSDGNEPVIDLESSGIIEFEHARLCGGHASDVNRMDIVEPQVNRRCAASDREILRSPFTDV